MINSKYNDTSVQPQTKSMGAALCEPQRGEMPMELVSN